MPRILIVEDNELSRDMLSRRLQKKGYEVATASDGEEGVAVDGDRRDEAHDLLDRQRFLWLPAYRGLHSHTAPHSRAADPGSTRGRTAGGTGFFTTKTTKSTKEPAQVAPQPKSGSESESESVSGRDMRRNTA